MEITILKTGQIVTEICVPLNGEIEIAFKKSFSDDIPEMQTPNHKTDYTFTSFNPNIFEITTQTLSPANGGEPVISNSYACTVKGKSFGKSFIIMNCSSAGNQLYTPDTHIYVFVTHATRPITDSLYGDQFLMQYNLRELALPRIRAICPMPLQNDQPFNFKFEEESTCRMGIFAAKNGHHERACVLFLPKHVHTNTVMIGIGHSFTQNDGAYYAALGWSNPLSGPLINTILHLHLIDGNLWAPQVLTATNKNLAYLHIIRASGLELGPFAEDGSFLLS